MVQDPQDVNQVTPQQEPNPASEGRPPFKERFVREVKTHPFGYTVLAIFLVAGPIASPFLFPQAPPAAAVFGGLAFGVYAALSAVPHKFM